MNNFIQTLSERKGELLEAAFQHLSISLISLLIAALIAIPLAIWAANHKKMAKSYCRSRVCSKRFLHLPY